MKLAKTIAAACALAMTAVAASVTAQDFNMNERTYLTFSGPVELPGVTLQPGTYLFRLADSPSNRHIIRVMSQDEKQVHATILAVPAERLEVTGENVVTFRETAEGNTPAVQYWYYPGDRIGHEFVYPKDQAQRIAARTGQNVLTTDGDVASADTRVSSIGPDGAETEWERENNTNRTARDESGAVAGTSGVSQMGQSETTNAQTQSQGTMAQGTATAQGETVNPESETVDPESETPPAESTTAQTTEPQQGTASAQSSQTQSGVEAGAQARTQTGAMAGRQDQTRTDREAVGTSGQVQTDAANRNAQDDTMNRRANELPRTASPLPLSGLIGLLSLGGALALRRARK